MPDSRPTSLLFRSARQGKPWSARKALDAGARLDAVDADGRTPLLWACEQRHAEVARFLLERGACPLQAEPLSGAASARGALHLALSRAADEHLCDSSALEMIRLLADHGADVNACDSRGLTPLMLSAMHGLPLCLRFLLSRGARFDAVDHDGCSALHHCAFGFGGELACAAALIEAGSDWSALEHEGYDARMLSRELGDGRVAEIIEALVERGELDRASPWLAARSTSRSRL